MFKKILTLRSHRFLHWLQLLFLIPLKHLTLLSQGVHTVSLFITFNEAAMRLQNLVSAMIPRQNTVFALHILGFVLGVRTCWVLFWPNSTSKCRYCVLKKKISVIKPFLMKISIQGCVISLKNRLFKKKRVSQKLLNTVFCFGPAEGLQTKCALRNRFEIAIDKNVFE